MSEHSNASESWIGKQSWRKLLFAHWPADYANLRAKVPTEFEIDLYDGEPWVGVVPFEMSGVRLRGLPPIPGVSYFQELNLRTYVRYRGRLGVYFFSLDANQRMAVWAARTFFHLPYFRSRMSLRQKNDGLHYRSCRIHPGEPQARFECKYHGGTAIKTTSGDLVDWLTERYCFFTKTKSGNILRGDIHHQQWPLQTADAEMITNQICSSLDVVSRDVPPLLHYSENLDVKICGLHRDER